MAGGAGAGAKRMEVDSHPDRRGCNLPTPGLLVTLPNVPPPAPRAPPACGQGSATGHLAYKSPCTAAAALAGLAATATPRCHPGWDARQALLAAMQEPAEPPGDPANPSEGFLHHALWELRASYQVHARGAGREHLLAYIPVGQWRHVVVEGPPAGPLPAAARKALAEAAAVLQTELDVAQLAEGRLGGALSGWVSGLGVRALGCPRGLGPPWVRWPCWAVGVGTGREACLTAPTAAPFWGCVSLLWGLLRVVPTLACSLGPDL